MNSDWKSTEYTKVINWEPTHRGLDPCVLMLVSEATAIGPLLYLRYTTTAAEESKRGMSPRGKA